MRNLLSVPALMEESAPGYRGEARGLTGRQGGKSKGTAVRDARAWRLLVISVAYPPAHSVAARTGLSRQTEALSGRFIEIEVPLSGIPVLTQAPPEATSDIARCARKKPAALD